MRAKSPVAVALKANRLGCSRRRATRVVYHVAPVEERDAFQVVDAQMNEVRLSQHEALVLVERKEIITCRLRMRGPGNRGYGRISALEADKLVVQHHRPQRRLERGGRIRILRAVQANAPDTLPLLQIGSCDGHLGRMEARPRRGRRRKAARTLHDARFAHKPQRERDIGPVDRRVRIGVP